MGADKGESERRHRNGKVSLWPMDFESAVRRMLSAPPMPSVKPEPKRPKAAATPKKDA